MIHLRDFIDAITDDPTRENAPNYVEILSDINIFEEDGFCSLSIIAEPIRTRIHAYLTREERDFYVPILSSMPPVASPLLCRPTEPWKSAFRY